MTRRHRIDCPHERRPGMAVCLHCLHAERVAAQERRQRILVRAAVGVIIFAVITAGANAGWRSFRDNKGAALAATASGRGSKANARRPTVTTAALTTPPETPIVTDSLASASASQPAVADRRDTATAVTANVSATDSTRNRATPSPSVLLPQGRTDLTDSLFAVRTGDTVVVHFDTSPARTRRADKFDRIVRQTLPVVYGPIADSALAVVAEGKLASPGDLLTELPSRGIHLQVAGGYRISLWPETRQGRDGPLVVAYRTMVGR